MVKAAVQGRQMFYREGQWAETARTHLEDGPNVLQVRGGGEVGRCGHGRLHQRVRTLRDQLQLVLLHDLQLPVGGVRGI